MICRRTAVANSRSMSPVLLPRGLHRNTAPCLQSCHRLCRTRRLLSNDSSSCIRVANQLLSLSRPSRMHRTSSSAAFRSVSFFRSSISMPTGPTSNWHRAVLWEAGAHTGFMRHRYLGLPPKCSPHRIFKRLSSLISPCSTTPWLSSCCYG